MTVDTRSLERQLGSAIRALHVARIYGEEHTHGVCLECRQVWPCETTRTVTRILND